MKYLLYTIFLIVFSLSIPSCGDDTPTTVDCTGVVATYGTTVSLILNNSCAFAGCHESATLAGNVDFSNYSTTSTYLKKASNQFLCSINHSSGCEAMPQGLAKLDAATIKTLTCWYNSGYPN